MEKVRIQDDLYNHVNGEWLEKAVIPDDLPTTGGFSDLAQGVEKILINDFNEMNNTNSYPNEYLKRAVTLFNKLKDVKTRNELGITPILAKLAKIKSISSFVDLNKKLHEFVIEGITLPFSIDVDADMKDTIHHCVMIQGPSVILPDTTYYKEEMAQQKQMLISLWSNMAKTILKYSELTEEEQTKYLEDTLKFDEMISTLVKSSEEWSEYTKIYNPMKTTTVANLLKPLKFKKLLKDLFKVEPDKIIVTEPRYFKAFKTIINEETFTIFMHWCYVMELIGSCTYLSEELRDISSTYRRALTGVSKLPSVEKYAYSIASSVYSEPVGLYYGDKYFGLEAKKDVYEMVDEIIETYKKRIKNNDFLTEQTKDKAVIKLSMMKVHMGYPDKVDKFYDKLVFDESDNAYEILTKLSTIRRLDAFSKLYEDVDRDKWVMPGHMVNACYNPFTNDITFPAAILQAPFYSIKQTRSQNLGGIGAVIGHEISHAFDNNGAKCDEYGNINNWWTKEDNRKFNNKTKAMIKEFDGIELPWGVVNGKFIVSENIADNGGMAVTLDIMNNMENCSYEEYFINWARVWCIKAKPEYLQLLLAIDVHAPAILRANMQPRNFEEWYKTFNVKKTDKMYLAPNKRVLIW